MALRLVLPFIFNCRKSFRRDACQWVRKVDPNPVILGAENIPQNAPFLLVFNHYFRPKYKAWWLTLAASAIIPQEIHFIMAATWTYPDHPFGQYLEMFFRLIFKRLAHIYNFSLMPPMPPRPWEVESRARAVRNILAYVRKNPEAAIGMSPEGSDSLTGALEKPASGVGRFLLHLAQANMPVHPLGIYECNGELILNFGKPISLFLPSGTTPEERDERVSQIVMQAIADLLPIYLRGFYNKGELAASYNNNPANLDQDG